MSLSRKSKLPKQTDSTQTISASDIDDLSRGAHILGSGGGGDPYIAALLAKESISRLGPVSLLEAADVPDDALIVMSAIMGSPGILSEKLPSGKGAIDSIQVLEKFLGEKIDAIVSAEIGGMNGVHPVYSASINNLPLVDADFMGRAFSELQMTTAGTHGINVAPMSLVDGLGNNMIIDTTDNLQAESMARSATIHLGGCVSIALYPMRGKDLKEAAVIGSVKHALNIGRAINSAKTNHQEPISALCEAAQAEIIFRGKVQQVERSIEEGKILGKVQLTGNNGQMGQIMDIFFQNEYLVAKIGHHIAITVPDIIVILESRTGAPVLAEQIFTGLDVVVVGIPVSPKWLTKEGLALISPAAFGYNIEYDAKRSF